MIKFKDFFKKFIFTIVIIAIVFFLSIELVRLFLYPRTHFDLIQTSCTKYSVDPYLILAIIKTESNFNSFATSKKQAKGLMQIMDKTAEELSENVTSLNLYDTQINIDIGCKYFSKLIKRYNGNYYIAICAYNAGMGNVDKWIEQGLIDVNLCDENISLPYTETNNYLKKVIYSYKIYRLLY